MPEKVVPKSRAMMSFSSDSKASAALSSPVPCPDLGAAMLSKDDSQGEELKRAENLNRDLCELSLILKLGYDCF
jgi:hypothetical protein